MKLNKAVLSEGYEYADKLEVMHSHIFEIAHADKMPKGRYRNITGNVATAWGLLAASEKSGRRLFLGSYPIMNTYIFIIDQGSAAIRNITPDERTIPKTYYDLSGRRMEQPRGLCIERWADGSSRKVYMDN